MKRSEIREAVHDIAEGHLGDITYGPVLWAAKKGALWMQDVIRDRIKLAMGALWDEDEITGSLWLGSTAICQIKAALEIEPEVEGLIPFDGEGDL